VASVFAATATPMLTTQPFFPGEPRNAQDGIYRDSLLLKLRDAGSTRSAKFNLVLDLA
jgi:hypothetical protein